MTISADPIYPFPMCVAELWSSGTSPRTLASARGTPPFRERGARGRASAVLGPAARQKCTIYIWLRFFYVVYVCLLLFNQKCANEGFYHQWKSFLISLRISRKFRKPNGFLTNKSPTIIVRGWQVSITIRPAGLWKPLSWERVFRKCASKGIGRQGIALIRRELSQKGAHALSCYTPTVSSHNSHSQNVKLRVSSPMSKYIVLC